jgi:hypothetical protein
MTDYRTVPADVDSVSKYLQGLSSEIRRQGRKLSDVKLRLTRAQWRSFVAETSFPADMGEESRGTIFRMPFEVLDPLTVSGVDSLIQDAVTAAANTHEAQLQNMLPLMYEHGCGVRVWRWYEDDGDHRLVAHQETRIDLETLFLTVAWMPFGQRPPS